MHQAVRISGIGRLDLSESDVGWVEEASAEELVAVAAGLNELDWQALESAAIEFDDVPDGQLAWNIARFKRELIVLDRDLPDPRPRLFTTAAELMDERITHGP